MKWCKSPVLMLLFSFMSLSCAKENRCPGSKASCPEHSTCCKLLSGSYGCCPIKNAICCQDSVHCCPEGYTCDIVKAVCQMGDKSKPLLKKIPTMPTVVCSWFLFLFSYYLKPVCSAQGGLKGFFDCADNGFKDTREQITHAKNMQSRARASLCELKTIMAASSN